MHARTTERLRNLRRLREQRALETVAWHEAVLRTAREQAEDAAAVLAAHLERTAAEERAAITQLVGRPVTIEQLQRMRARLEACAEEANRLREREANASAGERERRDDLARAQAELRARRRSVARFDSLLDGLQRRARRRQLARAELAEEEGG